MHLLKLTTILLITLSFVACEDKEGTIIIENGISNTEINTVYWGSEYISSSLLPGQESSLTIYDDKDGFPKIEQVSFVMNANSKSVYLVTLDEYELEADMTLRIILTDSTRVE